MRQPVVVPAAPATAARAAAADRAEVRHVRRASGRASSIAPRSTVTTLVVKRMVADAIRAAVVPEGLPAARREDQTADRDHRDQ